MFTHTIHLQHGHLQKSEEHLLLSLSYFPCEGICIDEPCLWPSSHANWATVYHHFCLQMQWLHTFSFWVSVLVLAPVICWSVCFQLCAFSATTVVIRECTLCNICQCVIGTLIRQKIWATLAVAQLCLRTGD